MSGLFSWVKIGFRLRSHVKNFAFLKWAIVLGKILFCLPDLKFFCFSLERQHPCWDQISFSLYLVYLNSLRSGAITKAQWLLTIAVYFSLTCPSQAGDGRAPHDLGPHRYHSGGTRETWQPRADSFWFHRFPGLGCVISPSLWMGFLSCMAVLTARWEIIILSKRQTDSILKQYHRLDGRPNLSIP